MKIALIAFFLVAVAAFPLGISYGDYVESQLAKNKFYIFAQIKIQNSDGQLVAYLEAKKITVLDFNKLNNLLNQNSAGLEKSNVTISGQKYEVIKGVGVIVHSTPTVISLSDIEAREGNSSQILALAFHDGYPVVPGDKVTKIWTIFRPAP